MKRAEPPKGDPTYRQIWRVVDGAVRQALEAHPEYVAAGLKPKTVRDSITKRVTGALHGYAEQSAWVRSGSSSADDMVSGPARLGSQSGLWKAPARREGPLTPLPPPPAGT